MLSDSVFDIGGTGRGMVTLYKKTKGKWEIIDETEAENVGCEYGEY